MDWTILFLIVALLVFVIAVLSHTGKPSRLNKVSVEQSPKDAPAVRQSTKEAEVPGSTEVDSPSPRRFIVFDLETTGLDPEKDEIIEIGAIKANMDSNVHDTFQVLVKPSERIPRMITRINGISQEMVDRDGEPLDMAIRDFVEFIGDLPLVSYNAQFDMGFLDHAARAQGIVVRNHVSCALKMARRAWPGRKSYKLIDIAKDGNLSAEGTHRALGDCTRTLMVYAAALKLGAAN